MIGITITRGFENEMSVMQAQITSEVCEKMV
jgi:hypothetical protein